MTKRVKRTPNMVQGRGYVGRWADGTIGWCLPDHLSGYSRPAEKPTDRMHLGIGVENYGVLCEITVRVVKDKLGREIRRKAPRG